MHPDRRRRLEALRRAADAGNWEQVYRQHVLWEFPSEVRMGFQLAFLRPFCDPQMAAVLVRAGRITGNAKTRAYDTGIVIYEIIADGLDGERAQRMIRHMNRQHGHDAAITQEQLTYVLASFVVIPTRYVEQAGWRRVLDVEREAAAQFYRALGERMGIARRHGTYADAERIVDKYEAAHLAPNEDTLALGEQLVQVIADRLPRPMHGVAGPFLSTQIRDDTVARSVGLPRAPRPARALDRSVKAVRRRVVRHLPPPSTPVFAAGQAAGPYTAGYALEDIEKP